MESLATREGSHVSPARDDPALDLDLPQGELIEDPLRCLDACRLVPVHPTQDEEGRSIDPMVDLTDETVRDIGNRGDSTTMGHQAQRSVCSWRCCSNSRAETLIRSRSVMMPTSLASSPSTTGRHPTL